MSIPDKAVEAAARAHHAQEVESGFFLSEKFQNWDTLDKPFRTGYLGHARTLLEAAAPYIAAQALRSAVTDLEPHNGRRRLTGDEFREGIDYAQEALTDRANELDPR